MVTTPNPISLKTKIQQLLEEAESFHQKGTPDSLHQAVTTVDEGLALIPQLPAYERHQSHFIEANLWLVRGNATRDLASDTFEDTLKSYRKGLAALEGKSRGTTPVELQLPANLWTNCGITLLRTGSHANLREAISCFDKAIGIRDSLPKDMHNVLWGLAAGWMNRGDAFMQQGTAVTAAEAVVSYDHALSALKELATFDHPPFVIRYAVCWMNRGHALMSTGNAEVRQEALTSLESSRDTLRNSPTPNDPEHLCTLACVQMSHASIVFADQTQLSIERSRSEVQEALLLVAPFEEAEPFAAEISLKSRHLFCRILATLLDKSGPAAPEFDDWINEVTDVVDDGMKLERSWELRGLPDFRPLACELFRFGCRVFLIRQPHFLAEFILDSLDPERSEGAPVTSREIHHVASACIWDAALEIERRSKQPENAGAHGRFIELLNELHEADSRLAVLRQTHLAQ